MASASEDGWGQEAAMAVFVMAVTTSFEASGVGEFELRSRGSCGDHLEESGLAWGRGGAVVTRL